MHALFPGCSTFWFLVDGPSCDLFRPLTSLLRALALFGARWCIDRCRCTVHTVPLFHNPIAIYHVTVKTAMLTERKTNKAGIISEKIISPQFPIHPWMIKNRYTACI